MLEIDELRECPYDIVRYHIAKSIDASRQKMEAKYWTLIEFEEVQPDFIVEPDK